MSKTQHGGDCTTYAAYHWNPTDGISMQSSDRKPAMSNNIPGVPEGWRIARIGVPEIGETVIDSEGKPMQAKWKTTGVFTIIERIPPAWQPPEYPMECKKPWIAGIACDRHGWSVYSSPPAYKKYWDAGRESCIKWLGLPPVPEEHWADSWMPNQWYDPQAKWPE